MTNLEKTLTSRGLLPRYLEIRCDIGYGAAMCLRHQGPLTRTGLRATRRQLAREFGRHVSRFTVWVFDGYGLETQVMDCAGAFKL